MDGLGQAREGKLTADEKCRHLESRVCQLEDAVRLLTETVEALAADAASRETNEEEERHA